MITPRENYYRLFEGKMPDYVPVFDMMPYPGSLPHAIMQGPSCCGFHGPEGGLDPWGVEYISNPESGYSSMPKTWDFIMSDISDWRKIIKNPDLDAIPWETMSKQDAHVLTELMGVDRNQTLVLGVVSGGYFQDLMGFMGFTEGLCALVESPDEVKAMFDYMTEYYLKLQKYIIQYYSPDAIYLIDDTAAKENPFISHDMFRELLLPYYKVLIDDAKSHGLPVQFHNCGRSEEFMADLADEGVGLWDPAQTTNDLIAFKEKHGSKIAFAGGWDWEPPITWPIVDESDIRRQIRDTIDKYAPGGGFAMTGGANVVGQAGDDLPITIRGWVLDEIKTYGATFYQK